MKLVIRTRRQAFTLLLVVACLSLLATLASAFYAMASLERSIGANFSYRTRARIAAESGLEYAMGKLTAWGGGPLPDAMAPVNGIAFGRDVTLHGVTRHVTGVYSSGISNPADDADLKQSGDVLTHWYTVNIQDETGKLNINDSNGCWENDASQPRLERLIALLFDLLLQDTRGGQVANTLLHDAQVGRASFANDQFPSMDDVETALRAVPLSANDISTFMKGITIYSWQDPNVIQPCARVFGPAGNQSSTPPGGVKLLDMTGQPIDRWLQFQTREFALEPRCPVNVNTASKELIQAILQPLQGVYLQEGPTDTQSSEHYGWWSTGLGTADPNRNVQGLVSLTQPFSADQARMLAGVIHNRIHGLASDENGDGADDLSPDQRSDIDGDGQPDPNPFETWDEFRHFLDHGIDGSDTMQAGSAAYDIWVGAGFGFNASQLLPKAPSFTDPHASTPPGVPPVGYEDTYRSHYQGIPFNLAPGLTNTNTLTTWYDGYFAQTLRDMVYANANPNSLYNDWNPNANMYLMVDKAQLTRYTTEFCFEPTGAFTLDASGYVAPRFGEPLAESVVGGAVKLYEIIRQTTQAQFLDGWQRGDPQHDAFQYLGEVKGKAWGSYYVTQLFPHAAPGGTIGDWTDDYGPHSRQPSLQSYPEPMLSVTGATSPVTPENYIANSMYDGCLMPATLERCHKYPTGVQLPNSLGALAHLNGVQSDPFLMDNSGLFIRNQGGPYIGQSTAYVKNSKNTPSCAPLQISPAAPMPGNLHPDGAYCETGRTLAYSMGNFNRDDVSAVGANYGLFTGAANYPLTQGTRGLNMFLRFWIKPNFHTGIASRIRKFVTGPSQPGLFGTQQWAAMYYMANPCSAYEDGRTGTPKLYSLPAAANARGGHYGIAARNEWTPTRCLLLGTAWMSSAPTLSNYRDFINLNYTSLSLTREYPFTGSRDAIARGLRHSRRSSLDASHRESPIPAAEHGAVVSDGCHAQHRHQRHPAAVDAETG